MKRRVRPSLKLLRYENNIRMSLGENNRCFDIAYVEMSSDITAFVSPELSGSGKRDVIFINMTSSTWKLSKQTKLAIILRLLLHALSGKPSALKLSDIPDLIMSRRLNTKHAHEALITDMKDILIHEFVHLLQIELLGKEKFVDVYKCSKFDNDALTMTWYLEVRAYIEQWKNSIPKILNIYRRNVKTDIMDRVYGTGFTNYLYTCASKIDPEVTATVFEKRPNTRKRIPKILRRIIHH